MTQPRKSHFWAFSVHLHYWQMLWKLTIVASLYNVTTISEINVKEIQQTTLTEILRKRLCVKWYISSDVNKDLNLKAKARTKDQTLKAKDRTKDLSFKAKAKDQGL